jgi:predicted nicotinamide N-methyase
LIYSEVLKNGLGINMTGYQVKTETFLIGKVSFQICSLLDRQQFHDPEGLAEKVGISSAMWPLFGMVWPCGHILADKMSTFPTEGKRILEMGCGIALASLVIHQQGGNVTATDYHPNAQEFLEKNVQINLLTPMLFQNGNWRVDNPLLGKFDLIIGSDLLYEKEHPQHLSDFIGRHANSTAQVILVDPGRGHQSSFSKRMVDLGFIYTDEGFVTKILDGVDFKGKVSSYQR